MTLLGQYLRILVASVALILMPATANAAMLSCSGNAASGELYDSASACANTTPAMQHIVSVITCNFVLILDYVLDGLYCGIQFSIHDILAALLSVYVAVFGLQILMGTTRLTASEILIRLLKIVGVWAFATQSAWGINMAFGFFLTLIGSGVYWVTQIIMPAGGSSSADPILPLYAYLDSIVYYSLTGPFTQGNAKVIGFFAVMGYSMSILCALAGYWLWLTLVTLARCIVSFLLGISAIAFLISLSPIFLSFMLFKATAVHFESWLRYMMSYSIQIIIIFAIMSLWIVITSMFIGFFSNLSAMIYPINRDVVTGAIESPDSTWGVCDANYGFSAYGLLLSQCKDTPPAPEDLIAPSKLPAEGNFVYYAMYDLISLTLIAFAFSQLMQQAPSLAQQIVGPAYAPMLAQQYVGSLGGSGGGSASGAGGIGMPAGGGANRSRAGMGGTPPPLPQQSAPPPQASRDGFANDFMYRAAESVATRSTVADAVAAKAASRSSGGGQVGNASLDAIGDLSSLPQQFRRKEHDKRQEQKREANTEARQEKAAADARTKANAREAKERTDKVYQRRQEAARHPDKGAVAAGNAPRQRQQQRPAHNAPASPAVAAQQKKRAAFQAQQKQQQRETKQEKLAAAKTLKQHRKELRKAYKEEQALKKSEHSHERAALTGKPLVEPKTVQEQKREALKNRQAMIKAATEHRQEAYQEKQKLREQAQQAKSDAVKAAREKREANRQAGQVPDTRQDALDRLDRDVSQLDQKIQDLQDDMARDRTQPDTRQDKKPAEPTVLTDADENIERAFREQQAPGTPSASPSAAPTPSPSPSASPTPAAYATATPGGVYSQFAQSMAQAAVAKAEARQHALDNKDKIAGIKEDNRQEREQFDQYRAGLHKAAVEKQAQEREATKEQREALATQIADAQKAHAGAVVENREKIAGIKEDNRQEREQFDQYRAGLHKAAVEKQAQEHEATKEQREALAKKIDNAKAAHEQAVADNKDKIAGIKEDNRQEREQFDQYRAGLHKAAVEKQTQEREATKEQREALAKKIDNAKAAHEQAVADNKDKIAGIKEDNRQEREQFDQYRAGLHKAAVEKQTQEREATKEQREALAKKIDNAKAAHEQAVADNKDKIAGIKEDNRQEREQFDQYRAGLHKAAVEKQTQEREATKEQREALATQIADAQKAHAGAVVENREKIAGIKEDNRQEREQFDQYRAGLANKTEEQRTQEHEATKEQREALAKKIDNAKAAHEQAVADNKDKIAGIKKQKQEDHEQRQREVDQATREALENYKQQLAENQRKKDDTDGQT